jgi:hypothetical protein
MNLSVLVSELYGEDGNGADSSKAGDGKECQYAQAVAEEEIA